MTDDDVSRAAAAIQARMDDGHTWSFADLARAALSAVTPRRDGALAVGYEPSTGRAVGRDEKALELAKDIQAGLELLGALPNGPTMTNYEPLERRARALVALLGGGK